MLAAAALPTDRPDPDSRTFAPPAVSSTHDLRHVPPRPGRGGLTVLPPRSNGVLAGGDEGNRTPNPCLAKAVLCQLSYVPWTHRYGGRPTTVSRVVLPA